MDAKTLQNLRPRDTSAAGITAAIDRMESVLIELRGELAATEGARRGLLLNGTTADLDRNEARARTLRTDIERMELAIEELRPSLSLAVAK